MSAIASGTLIRKADRAAWLAERKKGIGASECAAALGVSPYCSPLELYLRKIGQLPEVAETAAMRRGSALEGVILDEYRDWAGPHAEGMVEQVFIRHPERPFLTATLDGLRRDGVNVEVKSVGWRSAREWGDEGTDEIPWHYLCQVHHQLAVSGAEVAHVAALIGGSDFRVYRVGRDEQLVEGLVAGLTEFWDRVTRRVPPEPGPGDVNLVHAVYRARGEMIDLGHGEAILAERYEAIGAQVRELQRARDEAKAHLVLSLKGAAKGLLPDGRVVKFQGTEVPERTQTIKAHTRHDFRILKARD